MSVIEQKSEDSKCPASSIFITFIITHSTWYVCVHWNVLVCCSLKYFTAHPVGYISHIYIHCKYSHMWRIDLLGGQRKWEERVDVRGETFLFSPDEVSYWAQTCLDWWLRFQTAHIMWTGISYFSINSALVTIEAKPVEAGLKPTYNPALSNEVILIYMLIIQMSGTA